MIEKKPIEKRPIEKKPIEKKIIEKNQVEKKPLPEKKAATVDTVVKPVKAQEPPPVKIASETKKNIHQEPEPRHVIQASCGAV